MGKGNKPTNGKLAAATVTKPAAAPSIVAKVEGTGFEIVKGAREEILRVENEMKKRLEESYEKMWAAIKQAMPDIDINQPGLQLDTSTEELGFYLLRRS